MLQGRKRRNHGIGIGPDLLRELPDLAADVAQVATSLTLLFRRHLQVQHAQEDLPQAADELEDLVILECLVIAGRRDVADRCSSLVIERLAVVFGIGCTCLASWRVQEYRGAGHLRLLASAIA